MADKTAIEWTDASWSPIRARYWEIQDDGSGKDRIGWHCTHVSEGCRNCYAERINRRLGTGRDYAPDELYREEKKGYRNGEVKLFLDEKMLEQPLRWRSPRRIFVCSMTDLFADFVPDDWIDRVFAVMALAPQHTFQVLTKRAERMRDYLAGLPDESNDDPQQPHQRILAAAENAGFPWNKGMYDHLRDLCEMDEPCLPLPNVWLAVSVEDQQRADERIPLLLETSAAKRFISAEPLLGPIDLARIRIKLGAESWMERSALYAKDSLNLGREEHRLDWVIAGGESGPGARPMHPIWARSLRDQCQAAGVAFHFKQWGAWQPHKVVAGGDLGADTRADRVRIVHPSARSNVEISGATGGYSTEPGSRYMARVGKKAAGRMLDGRTWDEFPA